MLRLLVVAGSKGEEVEMLARAGELVTRWNTPAEIVVVAAGTRTVKRRPRTAPIHVRTVRCPVGSTSESRLDAGLFLRPLADEVVVVGSDAACTSTELGFLSVALGTRPDLGAVMADDDLGLEFELIGVYGGAFRAGPLCQAGGFTGDGSTTVAERLRRVGFASVSLPPVRALDPDSWGPRTAFRAAS